MADTTLYSFSKKIDEKLVEPLRRTLVGRKLVEVTPPAGFGVSAVEWSTITEMSEGMVSYAFTSGADGFNASPTTSKVPVYWKDYTIDRRLYEGFLVKGFDPDASAALSAAYVAAKVEDTAIIKGVVNDAGTYDINGLYEGAGNDYSTTTDFATAGNATDAVAAAYDLLGSDEMPIGEGVPYNLVLARTQYMQLLGIRNTNGIREMPEVKEMLNGGNIIMSNAMTAGTGMLLPTSEVIEPYVDFYLTADWQTEHGVSSEHPNTGDLYGRVFSAGILRIKHNVAICKLSDI
jgi:uncharacterized linocin/CFP29 family protein